MAEKRGDAFDALVNALERVVVEFNQGAKRNGMDVSLTFKRERASFSIHRNGDVAAHVAGFLQMSSITVHGHPRVRSIEFAVGKNDEIVVRYDGDTWPQDMFAELGRVFVEPVAFPGG